jgi:hypothetical protein
LSETPPLAPVEVDERALGDEPVGYFVRAIVNDARPKCKKTGRTRRKAK